MSIVRIRETVLEELRKIKKEEDLSSLSDAIKLLIKEKEEVKYWKTFVKSAGDTVKSTDTI